MSTDRQPGDHPMPEDCGTQKCAETDANGASESQPMRTLSPIDEPSRDLVLAEEDLWGQLRRLKETRPSLEARIALRDTYSGLAWHYAGLGGNDSAVRFLKNALAQADDPALRHQLARLQALTDGYDFIASFTDLLKGRAYDLKFALEFCYFLERSNLHEAALNVLETELKKRLKLTEAPDPNERSTIDSFFRLLQVVISTERQIHLQHYEEIFTANFPESIVGGLSASDEQPEETIAGQELEEFEVDHGLKDELVHCGKLLAFFAEHYIVPTSIAVASLVLIFLSIFRVDAKRIELVGDSFILLLLAYFSFELLRSLRFAESTRLRAHMKLSRNATVAMLTMMILQWLGSPLFGQDGAFFSLLAVKVMSSILVATLFWSTYLSMSAIRRSLRRIRLSILNALQRRAFRRQFADLVSGTSKWYLIFSFAAGLQLLTRGSVLIALFAAGHLLFLVLCWRWGNLEARAEKQKLRDALAFIIAVVFLALVAIELQLELSPWEIVLSLSLDGVLVLAVAITFALQVTSIGMIPLTAASLVFGFLNFAPSLDKIGFLLNEGLYEHYLAQISLVTRLVEVVLLGLIAVFVKRSRQSATTQVFHGEVYMAPKYNFEGGQFGVSVVGDGASASNFTQVWGANALRIDLAALASELADLKVHLVAEAREPSHFAAIAEVASAEQAAIEGKGEVALERIKAAGTWVWDVATKIGIGVASAAAKQALGL